MLLSNVHKQGAKGINMYLLADYRSTLTKKSIGQPIDPLHMTSQRR